MEGGSVLADREDLAGVGDLAGDGGGDGDFVIEHNEGVDDGEGRPWSWLAAFALDALQHGGFLAAHISPGGNAHVEFEGFAAVVVELKV